MSRTKKHAKTNGSLLKLLFPALFVFPVAFLAACSAPGKTPDQDQDSRKNAVQIEKKELTASEESLMNLTNTHFSTSLFHYNADASLQELHFFAEEWKDGVLSPIGSGTGGPVFQGIADSSETSGKSGSDFQGDIAILIDRGDNPGVTFSWQDGNGSGTTYTPLEETFLHSALTSLQDNTLQIPYNQKIPLVAVAENNSDFLEAVCPADYSDLLSIADRQYERVLFFGVVFTDFPVEQELVSFHGTVRDSADLSPETLDWLTWYNTLPLEQQLAQSHLPPEFLEATESKTDTP